MLRHDSSNVLVFDTSKFGDNSFFNGSFNTLKLDFDPLINGYSFFKWTVLPKWVRQAIPNFAEMTEKNFLEGFSINDMELETSSITWGFAQNEYNVATNSKKGNTDFSIKHREFSGSPIRNAYQYWITGIRDPETGIATYCRIAGTDYAAKNHTGEIIYIVTRPDANNVDMNNIEYSCYYTAVLPTKIQLSQFSFSHGDHSLTEYEQSFKACFHMGSKVDAFAKAVLKEKTYGIMEMNEFDPLNPSHGKNNLSDPEYYGGSEGNTITSSASSNGFDHSQGGNASEL